MSVRAKESDSKAREADDHRSIGFDGLVQSEERLAAPQRPRELVGLMTMLLSGGLHRT